MRCQYCDKRLGITKILKGATFCSLEHQELYHESQSKEAFDRLRASAEYPFHKSNLSRREQAPPEPTQEVESNAAEESAAGSATEENEHSAPFEIAALADAVERTAASELRQAPFLEDVPTFADQPALPLESFVAEPVPALAHPASALIQMPVSSTPQAISRSSPRVVDVSPASPSARETPGGGGPTWPSVPPGYPPIVVSSSGTLVIDPKGADLIPLPVGKPYSGDGPVRLPQARTIETLPRQPQLPSWQGRSNLEGAAILARPPEGSTYEVSWVPRLGSGYALPPLENLLSSQDDMLRMVEPGSRNLSAPKPSMCSSTFFAVKPDSVRPPNELPAPAAAYLPASLIPRNTMQSEKAAPVINQFAFTIAPVQLAAESYGPLRGDPSASHLNTGWQQGAIANQLPSVAGTLAFSPAGLDMAADTLPVQRSMASAAPSTVATTPAVIDTPQFQLLSNPLTIAAPATMTAPAAETLHCEPCVLQSPENEDQNDAGLAKLDPSPPNPWSLVTWSRSISITNPACQPSDRSIPAPIALTAREGRVDPVPVSSASRRGSLVPLKPQPTGTMSLPIAPIQAPVRPPAVEPIRPGAQGTAPPALTAVRTQPASMPVRPVALPDDSEAGAATGPTVWTPVFEESLALSCVDVAHGRSEGACGLLAHSTTALPSFSYHSNAFSMAIAPCGQTTEWGPVAPGQPGVGVQPYPATTRSAWCVTTYLPASGLPMNPAKAQRERFLRNRSQL